MRSNPRNSAHHWLGQPMVKHCLLVLLTSKFEYSKLDNVKLTTTISTETTTEERVPAPVIVNHVLFCNPTIFILVVVNVVHLVVFKKRKK